MDLRTGGLRPPKTFQGTTMLWFIFVTLLAIGLMALYASFHFEIYPLFFIPFFLFLILAVSLYTTGITAKSGEFETEIGENHTTTYQYTTTGTGSNILSGLIMLGLAFFAIGGMVIYATKEEDRDYKPEYR